MVEIEELRAEPAWLRATVAEQAVDEIVRALGYIVGKKAGAPEGSRVTFELTGPNPVLNPVSVSASIGISLLPAQARNLYEASYNKLAPMGLKPRAEPRGPSGA